VNLAGYENDPAVGKYVNQDGLQQLRHYLKVGPYRSHLKGGSASNPFFGYLRQVIMTKRDLKSSPQLFIPSPSIPTSPCDNNNNINHDNNNNSPRSASALLSPLCHETNNSPFLVANKNHAFGKTNPITS